MMGSGAKCEVHLLINSCLAFWKMAGVPTAHETWSGAQRATINGSEEHGHCPLPMVATDLLAWPEPFCTRHNLSG